MSWISRLPLRNESNVSFNDYFYRRRLQSLQSVDEMIAELVEKLEAEGLLEETALDDLIQRLRERYPDALFERTLKQELDQAATERRAEAINELARIVARAAVRNLAKSKSVL